MVRLSKRSVRRTQGVTQTVYRVAVDDEQWPAPGDSFQTLAAEAYLAVVADAGGTPLAAMPAHVGLCVSRVQRHEMTPRITLDNSVMQNTRYTWIFAMEASDEDHSFECVGGASIQTVNRYSQRQLGKCRIRRVCLQPAEFYDTTSLQQETSLPSVPAGLSSPHDSVMSLSASEGMSVPTGSSAAAAAAAAASVGQHPLFDYAGTRPPDGLSTLKDFVTKTVSLETLLWDRYLDLENVARFTKTHGQPPAFLVAGNGTAAQHREAATIGLVGDAKDAEDARLQHAGHMVAHWLLREYVLPKIPAGSTTFEWFLRQEAHLVLLHERFAYTKEASFRDFLEPVFKFYNLERADPPAIAKKLDPSASIWYRINAVDALLLNLPIHKNAPRMVYVDPISHMMYFPAKCIMEDLLDKFVGACLHGLVQRDVQKKAEEDDIMLDTDNAQDGSAGEDDVLERMAEKIVDARTERITQASANLHLPRKDVQQEHLPHLDNETVPRNIMPLCKQRQWRKLTGEGHLKIGERFSWSSYLLDLGYHPDRIATHAKKHFMRGGTDSSLFESKYRAMVKRNEVNQWENGVRTRGYDYSCSRLIEGRDLKGDASVPEESACIGCPYARLGAAKLRQELQACGNVPQEDIEDIVDAATVGGNAARACTLHYKSLHNGVPYSSWKVLAPRTFTQEFMSRLHNYIEEGGSLE